MSNYDFNKDLPVAKTTEKEVGQLLQQKGAKIISYNDTNKYDILLHSKKWNKYFTVEVKEDFMCETTGNVAVEFSCRGKDSGIACSHANFYVYKIYEPKHQIHFYIMKTQKLKDMIKNKEYHNVVNGGDVGSNSIFYLFKLEKIKKISILLK